MAKFDIPRFKYLCQDQIGDVIACTKKPVIDNRLNQWVKGGVYYWPNNIHRFNENWRNTLIDLDVDDYEFDDGILRRIEK